jgi:hypothetical protein
MICQMLTGADKCLYGGGVCQRSGIHHDVPSAQHDSTYLARKVMRGRSLYTPSHVKVEFNAVSQVPKVHYEMGCVC